MTVGSEMAQKVAMLIVIIICLIILVIRMVYRQLPRYKHTDVPHFGCVLRFVFQIVDVFEDIFVCEWMYTNNDLNYFFSSLIFLILPFVMSLIFFIYFRFIKFNRNTLNKYLDQSELEIILTNIGFHCYYGVFYHLIFILA